MQSLQKRERIPNYTIMILEGSLFWGAMAFLDGSAVVSVFIKLFTDSEALAGLAAALRSGLYILGQVCVGMFLHSLKNQERFMKTMGFISRPMLLLLLPPLLMGAGGPGVAYLLIAVLSLFIFTDGFVGLLWTEILVRTVPIAKRGKVVSYQQVFGAVMGFLAGFVVRHVMGTALTPQLQYAILFACAGVLMSLDAIALSRIRDQNQPPPIATKPDGPRGLRYLAGYFRQFGPLFVESPEFRRVVGMRVLYLMSLAVAPLNALFAQTLNFFDAGLLLTLQTCGQFAGGIFWGHVSERYGYRPVMLLAQTLATTCALLAFVSMGMFAAGLDMRPALFVMTFLLSANNGSWIGFANQMILSVDGEKRAHYLILQAMLIAPVSFVSYAAGSIAQSFGYLPVYAMTFAASAAGLILTARMFFGRAWKQRHPESEQLS